MAQTTEGRIRQFCNKMSISVDSYNEKVNIGLKWCYKCQTWQPINTFSKDSTRFDNRSSKCGGCRKVKEKKCTKGRPSPMKGKKYPPEIAAKMRENILKVVASNRGRKKVYSEKGYKNLLKAVSGPRPHLRGPNNWRWKGSREEKEIIRSSAEYKEWRRLVFQRDNYTCQNCGDSKGGNLHAHHIKSFATYPELRMEVSNGLTLCEDCHEKHHRKPDSIRNKRKLKRAS